MKWPSRFDLSRVKIWRPLLSENRSFLNRFFGALVIAVVAHGLIQLVYFKMGLYFSPITILAVISIVFYSEFIPGILFVVGLVLALDYTNVLGAGDILETQESISYFIVAIVFTVLSTSLKNAYREMAKAVQARDLLIQVISHELKNPLTAILSGVQLVKKQCPDLEEDPLLRQVIKNISASTDRMIRLIADLLDISSFEAGRVVIHPAFVDLKSLLESVTHLFIPAAKEKGIQLTFSISPQCPDGMICDRDRIVQVLSNLIGNALKFTRQGKITLSVELFQNEELKFQVKDTGQGIPAEFLPKVFDRFWQAQSGKGGSGLGLSIVKKIIEASGGQVWVESQIGIGTSFYFTLPRYPKLKKISSPPQAA